MLDQFTDDQFTLDQFTLDQLTDDQFTLDQLTLPHIGKLVPLHSSWLVGVPVFDDWLVVPVTAAKMLR